MWLPITALSGASGGDTNLDFQVWDKASDCNTIRVVSPADGLEILPGNTRDPVSLIPDGPPGLIGVAVYNRNQAQPMAPTTQTVTVALPPGRGLAFDPEAVLDNVPRYRLTVWTPHDDVSVQYTAERPADSSAPQSLTFRDVALPGPGRSAGIWLPVGADPVATGGETALRYRIADAESDSTTVVIPDERSVDRPVVDRAEVSVVLQQDLEVSKDIVCAEVDGDYRFEMDVAALFYGPGTTPEEHGEARALVLGPGGTVSDVVYAQNTETSPTGWSEHRPFQHSSIGDDDVWQVLAATTWRDGAAGVLGFLHCDQGLLFTEQSMVDGSWSEPAYLLDPMGQYSVRIIYGRDGEPVLHTLGRSSGRVQLLIAFLHDDFQDGKPPYYSLEIDDIIDTRNDFGYDLVPLEQGLYAFVVVQDGVISTWMIRRESESGSPGFLDEEPVVSPEWDAGSVVSGFETGYDTDMARLLFLDGHGALWSCRYEYDPDTGLGIEYHNPERLHDGPLERIWHQPDLTEGRIVYIRGAHPDEAGAEMLWTLRALVPWGEGRPPAEWTLPLPANAELTEITLAAAAPSAYLCWDTSGHRLRLLQQDYTTGHWQQSRLRAPGDTAVDVTRYQVSATLVTAAGAPLPDYPVELSVAPKSPGCEVVLQGRTLWVTQSPTALRTDAAGTLTMTVEPDGLFCSDFLLEAKGIDPVTLRPTSDIRDYLAGIKDDLHPTNPDGALPLFDGDALKAIAPDADEEQVAQTAEAIHQLMLAVSGEGVGFAARLNSTDEGQSYISITNFHTRRDLSAATPPLPSSTSALQWSATDIWNAITENVLNVTEFVVDVADKAVNLVVNIKDEVIHIAGLAWEGLKELGRLVWAGLKWIGVQANKCLDWLRSMLDLDHMRNTWNAVQSAVPFGIAGLRSALDYYGTLGEEWFTEQEAVIQQAFETARQEMGDVRIEGPEPTDDVGDKERRLGDDAHANWMKNKLLSYPTPLPSFTVPESALERFAAAIEAEAGEIPDQTQDAFTALTPSFTSPEGYGGTLLASLLDNLEQLSLSALSVGSSVLTAVLELLTELVDEFERLINTELDLPWPLSQVWHWVASPGTPCTTLALVSLAPSFFATIGYKLTYGAGEQPFPDGTLIPDYGLRTTGNPAAGVVLGFFKIAGSAGVQSVFDALEVAAAWGTQGDPQPDPALGRLLGILELCWFAWEFGLTLAADYGSEDPWDQGLFAFALFSQILSSLTRIIKRCAVGIWDVHASVAETILGLIALGCGIYLITQAEESGDASRLAWAVVIGAIPDTFGFLTSVAGSMPPGVDASLILGGKIGCNFLCGITEGALIISGYSLRATPQYRANSTIDQKLMGFSSRT
ncbi:hypothetical protein [Streptomyces arboris]|uniref:hypothetical protein n=1 Tax=Streptomyces arboris TaxID=2600619 RepID=UPI003630D78D